MAGCPLLAQSGHGPVHCTCPLLGVKRTCRLHCKCLLLTQSGHRQPLPARWAEPLRCIVLSLGGNMRRREFIVGLCGAATMSFAVRAQQPAMPVVGFLRPGSPELNAHLLAAFRKGMGETGYVEGRNVAVEYRWADNDDRLRELAADLVRLRVNVIVTPGSTTAAAAAKSETRPFQSYSAAAAIRSRVGRQAQPAGGQCHRRQLHGRGTGV